MHMNDLSGKWVLVTGAASGIGRATALAFADAGASLILTDINSDRLESVRQMVAAKKATCIVRTADVSNEAEMQALADFVHAKVPAIDVLVNNAGIGYLGGFSDTSTADWERVLRVNVMGVVHGCRAFMRQMIAAGGARRIVNVASLAGIAPAPNMSAYAASKHAVAGLSEGISLELRLKDCMVGVTTVFPGIINTDITKARHNVASAISDAQLARLCAYYEAQGVEPEVVGDAIVRAVLDGKDLVLVGPFAKPIYHLRRISRRVAQWLMLADARKAGYV